MAIMDIRSNLGMYGLVSTALFACTILNAFRQRSNFYSAAVYLAKSNACMMILWNQGIYQTVLIGKLLVKTFFGELRTLETERLQERGWFAVTETLLALTIFRDEFDTAFILLFVSLLFLKVFHWLAADRVELMEQSANISSVFHARMISLLTILWVADVMFLIFSLNTIFIEGPTVMIMFASEYLILIASVWSISMKYGINAIDSRSEVPWEEKSIYVFYVDLAADFFKLVTYLAFFFLILTFYGLPLNILRDVYLTFRSFILKCRDLRRYRQATKNMNSLYPDASRIEMREMVDKTCIICREDMEYRGSEGESEEGEALGGGGGEVPPVVVPRTGPNDTPKKLPCGHVFHFHCLRSWLERQQSCPTCRRSVLVDARAIAAATAATATAAANAVNPAHPANRLNPRPNLPNHEEAIRQAQINLARNLGREAFAVVFPGLAYPPEADEPPLPGTGVGGGFATPTVLRGHRRRHEAAVAAALATANANVNVNGEVPFPPPTPTTTTTPVPTPTTNTSTTAPLFSTSRSSSGINTLTGRDNPLARFSLPDFKLPPTGEAGLYGPPGPSGALSGYAGIAYGAFQNNNSTRNSSTSTSIGSTSTSQAMGMTSSNSGLGIGYGHIGGIEGGGTASVRVPNLEERLTHVRSRMAQATLAAKALSNRNNSGTGVAIPVTLSSASSSNASTSTAASVNPASIPLPSTPSVSVNDTPIAGTSTSTPIPTTAREIAIAAAERRALRAKGGIPIPTKSTSRPITPTASPLPSPAIPLPLPHLSTSSLVSTPSSTRPSTATARNPSYFSSQPTTSTSTTSTQLPSATTRRPNDPAYPRLIPLFDPTSPLSTTLYPNLISSMPPSLTLNSVNQNLPRELPSQNLLNSSPTEVQLEELSRLTRKGIEERLRVIVGFQKRLDDIARDMSQVLSVLPKDRNDEKVEVEVEVNVEEEKEEGIDEKVVVGLDKGKNPIEGIHAPAIPSKDV